MTNFLKLKPGEKQTICFLPPDTEEECSNSLPIHSNLIIKPIPKSIISTKILLDAFTYLREELNGKCNDNFCPHIGIRYHRKFQRSFKKDRKFIIPFCTFCQESWDTDFCPCKSSCGPTFIFLRLDEVIYQLQKKLSKEYSS